MCTAPSPWSGPDQVLTMDWAREWAQVEAFTEDFASATIFLFEPVPSENEEVEKENQKNNQ